MTDVKIADELRSALFAVNPDSEERWLELTTERRPLAYVTDEQRKLARGINELCSLAIRLRGFEVMELHPTEEFFDELTAISSRELYEQGLRAVLVLEARQGGGNDECYCEDEDGHEPGCLWESNETMRARPEYLFDEYDSFDSTYLSMYFKLTEEQAEAFNAVEEASRAEATIERTIELTNDLEITPWAALSEDGVNDELAEATHRCRTLLSSMKNQKFCHSLADWLRVLQKESKLMDEGTTSLPNDDFNRAFTELRLRTSSSMGRHKVSSSMGLDSVGERLSEVQREFELARTCVAEAEALPEGSVLHEYLLGDRGQGSYMTKEKRGRRKVEVRKVFDRGSRLGKELESAERSYQTVLKLENQKLKHFINDQMNRAYNLVGKEELDAALNSDERRDLVAELNEARRQLFAIGWPGSPESLPAMPDSIFPLLQSH